MNVAADWESSDRRIRLYRGDCLEILPRLRAGSIDFVFMDPPYGHNQGDGDLAHRMKVLAIQHGKRRGGKNVARTILNDGPEANDFFRRSLPMLRRLMREGGCVCCCCCGGGGPDPQFARWSLWMDETFKFAQMVIWDKGPMGMGWRYRRSYETVLVASQRGGPMRWYDRSHKVENIIRPGHPGIKKIIPKRGDHPTPKPVGLAEHFIRLHTEPDDVVLDPFMGRASTGEACIRTGRRFVGIELDREHFAKSVERMERVLGEMPAAAVLKKAA